MCLSYLTYLSVVLQGRINYVGSGDKYSSIGFNWCHWFSSDFAFKMNVFSGFKLLKPKKHIADENVM